MHTKQRFRLPIWVFIPLLAIGLKVLFFPRVYSILTHRISGKSLHESSSSMPGPAGPVPPAADTRVFSTTVMVRGFSIKPARLPVAAQPPAPTAPTISLNFSSVPVVAFMQATYKNLLQRDYVIAPAVLGLERQFSVSIKSLPAKDLPAFVDRLLVDQGTRSQFVLP